MKYSFLQTLISPRRRTGPLFCALFLFVMTFIGSGFAATVDLIVDADQPTIVVGNSGTQTLTVSNTGDSATASVVLTYYTPIFCNLATSQPTLPSGVTSSVLYTNTSRFIPSAIQYTITATALNASGSISVSVGLTVPSGTPQTPSMLSWGNATVYPIAGGDTEVNLQDNVIGSAVSIDGASPGTVSSSSPALFLAPPFGTAYSDNSTTSTTGSVFFLVGNDKNAGATSQPFGLVFVLPPYIRYTSADSLTSCSVLFPSTTDLTLEQIVSCTNPTLLPASSSCLLSLLGTCIIPNLSPPTATVTIKVTGYPGATVGSQWTIASVFTTGSDVDQELFANVSSPGIVVPH